MDGRLKQPVSFNEFYKLHHAKVLTTVTVIIGRPSIASEATDEAFARALARWPQVSTMTSPAGWVVRVAHNYARRTLRRATMEATILRRTSTREVVDGPAGEAWEMVKDLAPQQRAVVTLRYVADLPEADISRILGITRGTVSAHHSAAIGVLRARLRATELEEGWVP
jgi:RNA polymerase sigma factor (sigma-70 family)